MGLLKMMGSRKIMLRMSVVLQRVCVEETYGGRNDTECVVEQLPRSLHEKIKVEKDLKIF